MRTLRWIMLVGLLQPAASPADPAAAETGSVAASETAPASRPSRVRWRPIDGGERESRESGRPVLYFFTADWCPICDALDRAVFSDPTAATLIEDLYVPVEVNDRRDANGESAQEVDDLKLRFLVSRLPALVVSMPDSGPAVSEDGSPVYSKMLRFLKTARPRLEELTHDWESKRLVRAR